MGIEVVVEGLTKSFGHHVVWRDVSLSLPPGEVSVMLGPSGTGKTVFLKSLVGLIKPDRGQVIVEAPETAVIFGMPQEAIATGMVDNVLPLGRIAEAISSFVRRR